MGATESAVAVRDSVFIHFDQCGLFGGNQQSYCGLVIYNSHSVSFNGFCAAGRYAYVIDPNSVKIRINGYSFRDRTYYQIDDSWFIGR